MPRAGLSPSVVTAAASALVDGEGRDSLTLARLATELGVKPPSLYTHVDGLEGLQRLVAIDGVERLSEVCRSAVMGRSGSEGLRAMAGAYRDWAVAHPGVYPLTQVARPRDDEYSAAADRLREPVLALLSSFGLPDDALVHAARSVRSALHGFALLQIEAGFGMDVDVDQSFEWMVDFIESGLTPR